jgi:hypothetical protein
MPLRRRFAGTDKLTYLSQCLFRENLPAMLQQLSKTQKRSFEVVDNVWQKSDDDLD